MRILQRDFKVSSGSGRGDGDGPSTWPSAMRWGYLADRFRAWWLLGLVLVIGGLTALPMEPLAFRTADWLFSLKHRPAWPSRRKRLHVVPILALGTVTPQAIACRCGALTAWGPARADIEPVHGREHPASHAHHVCVSAEPGVRTTLLWVSWPSPRWACWSWPYPCWRAEKGPPRQCSLHGPGLRRADAQVLFDRYSAYHHILVVDEGDARMLQFDDTRQTKMSRRNPVEGGSVHRLLSCR